jgi:hypothetical protein
MDITVSRNDGDWASQETFYAIDQDTYDDETPFMGWGNTPDEAYHDLLRQFDIDEDKGPGYIII